MCGNILPRTSLHHSCFFLPVSLSTYLLFIHNSSAQLWISCDTLWPFIYLRLQNKMVIHEMLTSIAGTSTRQMFLVCVPTMLACVVTAALWQARGRRSQKKRRLRIPVSVCNVHKIRWRWSSKSDCSYSSSGCSNVTLFRCKREHFRAARYLLMCALYATLVNVYYWENCLHVQKTPWKSKGIPYFVPPDKCRLLTATWRL